ALLLVAPPEARLLAAQRGKIGDEATRCYKAANIDVYRVAYGGIGVAYHHLPGTNENRITKASGPIQSPCAFQHQKFIDAAMILDHGGGPPPPCRAIPRVNRRASRLPSSLNQRCALSQIQTAGPVFEIESSVGCQSHN